MRISFLVVSLALAACAAPTPPEPPDNRAQAEAEVREAVARWTATAAAKDAEGFLSFYTDDAVLMVADAPDLEGTEALAGVVAAMMQDPAFSLRFGSDRIVAARSGDLAYETGHYTLTMSGPDGDPTTEKGHYVVVWRKQTDGSWKVALDAPVSDPPESNPAG
jgi:uncharacterized protein (TIGR02246 family)